MGNIFYEGSDGHIHSLGDDNSIKHYKYIKRIKSGSGYRYFYSQDEIDAYYKENKMQENKMTEHRMTENKMTEHRMTENIIREKRTPEKKKKDSNFNRNVKPIDSEYQRELSSNSKKNTLQSAEKKKKDSNFNKNTQTVKDIQKEDRKRKLKESINKKIDRTSKSVEKGRSAIEKRLNKAKKTAKNEAKGVKRASDAIRGKGDYSYDAHDTNPKSYWKYDRKKKRSTKAGKTGKIERQMIGAYRRTHPYE